MRKGVLELRVTPFQLAVITINISFKQCSNIFSEKMLRFYIFNFNYSDNVDSIYLFYLYKVFIKYKCNSLNVIFVFADERILIRARYIVPRASIRFCYDALFRLSAFWLPGAPIDINRFCTILNPDVLALVHSLRKAYPIIFYGYQCCKISNHLI